MAGQKTASVPEKWRELARLAQIAREHAYTPYSGFKVGAALEDETGKIHTGCNVENANFSEGCCAERVAVAKMVSEGGHKVKRIAIVTPAKEPCFPCGSCLQVLSEFGTPTVFSMDVDGLKYDEADFNELLPRRFSREHVEGR